MSTGKWYGLALREALLSRGSFEKALDGHSGLVKVVHSLQSRPKIWGKFQALLPYKGLWSGDFKLGNMKAIHSLDGFQPELVTYLGKIYDFWSALPPDSQDPDTVAALHLLCPKVDGDRKSIKSSFDSGLLFSKLNPDQRQHALILSWIPRSI